MQQGTIDRCFRIILTREAERRLSEQGFYKSFVTKIDKTIS